jgi:signal transduction histidine kinase
VNNIIHFPRARDERTGAFLDNPSPGSHTVQFYENDDFLLDTVASFLAAGLELGDRVAVISTREHGEGLLRRLPPRDVERALGDGKLLLLDARETLAKFMVGEMPDPDLFRDTLSRIMTTLKGDETRRVRIRAFGEMVDLLWRDGNSKAAIRLEELWNEAGEEHSFALLCAYVMGNFYKEGEATRFMEVCRNHSHVIPNESAGDLDDSNARLREVSFLQQRTRSLETEIAHRKELEGALRDALRERAKVEEELRASVKREQEARVRAERSESFKEVFLGILGHDLRNPLNTVLTTARLMTMRNELPPESNKRLGRIITSGVRMQRMIEQILDVARDRLAGGIPVERTLPRDLVPLVTRIVDEVRAANPGITVELRATECIASVDQDRFEQVVSNVLGNATVHGDTTKEIRLELGARDGFATLSVHNHGAPIDSSLMPRIFDPFKYSATQCRAPGLGLGLYISERIVTAHGGRIEVESSELLGTTFRVMIPGP